MTRINPWEKLDTGPLGLIGFDKIELKISISVKLGLILAKIDVSWVEIRIEIGQKKIDLGCYLINNNKPIIIVRKILRSCYRLCM